MSQLLRPKFPRNLTQRRGLVRYLAKAGWPVFDVKLLTGYALDRHERRRIGQGFVTGEHRRLLQDDDYRKERAEELVELAGIKA